MADFKTYRLYRKIPSGTSQDWKPTQITFKGRSEKEAMKKADKFWIMGGFGAGSICVKEVICK